MSIQSVMKCNGSGVLVKKIVSVYFLFTVAIASSTLIGWYGKVVGVTDGDTIRVLKEGSVTKIRLYGIDTPERKQPFGTKSKQRASELCFGKEVRVEPVTIDRYGRIVARIYLPDERELGEVLVSEGLAWWYEDYARGNKKLDSLQTAARIHKRGLWIEKNPIAPWKWRKIQREKK